VKYVPFKATQIPQSLGLNQRGNGATGDSERRPLATPLAAYCPGIPRTPRGHGAGKDKTAWRRDAKPFAVLPTG